ncbi:MAG TPA: hypothetical protein VFO64_00870 [Gaiellaceae bacterium]|jgi:hypothetical protein|nr:hypothetical protein [Gaiellaceae bacterium]
MAAHAESRGRTTHGRPSTLGALSLLGVLVFFLSWAGNSQTEEGNASYLGLEEGDWRALLNPVLAVWIIWLVSARRRAGRVGAIGAWLACVGLGAALVGNVLEFGLLGEPFLAEDPPGSGSWSWGWAPVLVGAPLALAGAVLFAAALVWERATDGR